MKTSVKHLAEVGIVINSFIQIKTSFFSVNSIGHLVGHTIMYFCAQSSLFFLLAELNIILITCFILYLSGLCL